MNKVNEAVLGLIYSHIQVQLFRFNTKGLRHSFECCLWEYDAESAGQESQIHTIDSSKPEPRPRDIYTEIGQRTMIDRTVQRRSEICVKTLVGPDTTKDQFVQQVTDYIDSFNQKNPRLRGEPMPREWGIGSQLRIIPSNIPHEDAVAADFFMERGVTSNYITLRQIDFFTQSHEEVLAVGNALVEFGILQVIKTGNSFHGYLDASEHMYEYDFANWMGILLQTANKLPNVIDVFWLAHSLRKNQSVLRFTENHKFFSSKPVSYLDLRIPAKVNVPPAPVLKPESTSGQGPVVWRE